eukprot:GHUV01052190.1.p1 GENE.GHUV01052190.1~~GHUV01052190.1.p1  ORF type:complete len:104 (-),score=16.26 GHUV01052190.1:83-394(-)
MLLSDRVVVSLFCSGTASSVEEGLAIAAEIGRYPLIIRPAFTLGGTGGGISYNREEFIAQVEAGIDASMTDQVILCGRSVQCLIGKFCVLQEHICRLRLVLMH